MKAFSQIRKKKYWVLGIILLLCLLFTSVKPFSGYSDRTYRRVKRQWRILTGGMVDVGGYYLRIECWGSGRTVVFESGLNQARATWGIVPGEIAKVARVCTYDRASVGESDDANFKRTSADVVRELKMLLEKAGEKGPFVLVGHSFGGLNVRLFATNHPNEVAGLVLVDPSSEDQYQLILDQLGLEKRQEFLRHEGGENGERMDILTSADVVRSHATPSSIPTILLSPSRGDSDQVSDSVRALTSKTLKLYPCGRLMRTAGTSHFIQAEEPEAVIESIDWVLKKPTNSC